MQPFTLRRPASAAIAVLAISLAGVVVAPATAAHAAPTAWTCAVDTFVWRTGVLHQAVVTSGIPAPTTGPALVSATPSATMTNLNAIALHPLTDVVYANNVGSPVGSNARVINPDGTVEDVSATVPFTNAPTTGYAGGTFTPDGHWLLADSSGRFANVDLTDLLSPTYGQVVYQGTIRDTSGGVASRWLSGDMAYRDSDDRVYFTTWGTTKQVGSIPRAAFFSNADIVPDFGPTVVVPGGVSTSGAASGFDSAGNLWMSTNLITSPATVPPEQSVWRLDAAALTGTDPIIPANPTTMPTGSGTDGFMCFAAPAAGPASVLAPAGTPTQGATARALAVTGSVTNALPIIGSAATSLFLGAALIFIAGARRRQTRSFQ